MLGIIGDGQRIIVWIQFEGIMGNEREQTPGTLVVGKGERGLSLAEKAVTKASHAGEVDIEAWARRLADDVADLTD